MAKHILKMADFVEKISELTGTIHLAIIFSLIVQLIPQNNYSFRV